MKRYFALISTFIAAKWPIAFTISLFRKGNKVQMDVEQIKLIVDRINSTPNCRLFVFGLGNDSLFWQRVNSDGKTVFMEDHPGWFEKVTNRNTGLDAYLIDYGTKRSEWNQLLETPDMLDMDFPSEVMNHEWDIVLVDAPAGYNDNVPGRMKSIYNALKLSSRPCDIFVHDAEREVESVYCDRFLKSENLISVFDGKKGELRYYRLIS